jgi:hypothetical protein
MYVFVGDFFVGQMDIIESMPNMIPAIVDPWNNEYVIISVLHGLAIGDESNDEDTCM